MYNTYHKITKKQQISLINNTTQHNMTYNNTKQHNTTYNDTTYHILT